MTVPDVQDFMCLKVEGSMLNMGRVSPREGGLTHLKILDKQNADHLMRFFPVLHRVDTSTSTSSDIFFE